METLYWILIIVYILIVLFCVVGLYILYNKEDKDVFVAFYEEMVKEEIEESETKLEEDWNRKIFQSNLTFYIFKIFVIVVISLMPIILIGCGFYYTFRKR